MVAQQNGSNATASTPSQVGMGIMAKLTEAAFLKEALSVAVRQIQVPMNVKYGIIAMLGLAGVSHVLPGPMLKMQSKLMGIPEWFIMCAGLLMICSSLVYYVFPTMGLFAVSVCMGGAFATAWKLPVVLHRPGGMIFSSLTLLASMWVEKNMMKYTWLQIACLCAFGFAVGFAGRVYAPTSPFFVGLSKKFFKKAKDEKKEEVKQAKEGIEKPVKSGEVGTTVKAVTPKTPKTTKRGVSPGAPQVDRSNGRVQVF
jgi:hypothetical protein